MLDSLWLGDNFYLIELTFHTQPSYPWQPYLPRPADIASFEYSDESELLLDIHIPKQLYKSKEKAAVMVYIHGGSYIIGEL